ncbi:MAG: hypothetical protein JWO83_1541 [Caulobacteraceae bacterium]|jgi:hypothetical protein|nr:hypothetical protein [Caulobacteraceae bacterium]
MIDAETAREAIAALAAAMAAILEDALEGAVATRATLPNYAETARDLRGASADIGVLASAMEIIARRAEAVE